MLNPYRYTAHPLPNFIAGHPPAASKFHGAQLLGQHPRVSYGPSPMTLRFTAVDDQVALCFAQWRPLLKGRKGNWKYILYVYYMILLCNILYIYIIYIWTIPVTACKKMKAARLRAVVLIWVCPGFLNPLMLWLVWLEENQLMVADASMISWHKKDKSLFSSKGLARALHSVAQISMAPACARPSECWIGFSPCADAVHHVFFKAHWIPGMRGIPH